MRPVTQPMTHSNSLQPLNCLFSHRAGFLSPQAQGKGDIFFDRQSRNQMKSLKHHPHLFPSPSGPFPITKHQTGAPIQDKITGRHPIQAGNQM
jgi:hypothetical protein